MNKQRHEQSVIARVAAIGTIVLCSVSTSSVTGSSSQSGSRVGERSPGDIVAAPGPLREGVGVVQEQGTTSSAQANAFYNQGVAYLHSFVWIEAARSFNQALRLDRNFAMAELGLSYALGELGLSAEARTASARAQRANTLLTPRE